MSASKEIGGRNETGVGLVVTNVVHRKFRMSSEFEIL